MSAGEWLLLHRLRPNRQSCIFSRSNTVEHDFNGHEVTGIHAVNGKKCYGRAFHSVNKLHDFTGMHYLSGKYCYDDFFRKNHARLYFNIGLFAFNDDNTPSIWIIWRPTWSLEPSYFHLGQCTQCLGKQKNYFSSNGYPKTITDNEK